MCVRINMSLFSTGRVGEGSKSRTLPRLLTRSSSTAINQRGDHWTISTAEQVEPSLCASSRVWQHHPTTAPRTRSDGQFTGLIQLRTEGKLFPSCRSHEDEASWDAITDFPIRCCGSDLPKHATQNLHRQNRNLVRLWGTDHATVIETGWRRAPTHLGVAKVSTTGKSHQLVQALLGA